MKKKSYRQKCFDTLWTIFIGCLAVLLVSVFVSIINKTLVVNLQFNNPKVEKPVELINCERCGVWLDKNNMATTFKIWCWDNNLWGAVAAGQPTRSEIFCCKDCLSYFRIETIKDFDNREKESKIQAGLRQVEYKKEKLLKEKSKEGE